MHRPQTVLLVGGTGRTGRLVLNQLLEHGVLVRAVVRPGSALVPDLARRPQLALTEAGLLALTAEQLQRLVHGCDAVISCLGHTLDLQGVFGPPHDLVTRATTRLCRATIAVKPATPVRFILMSSVSVHRAGRADARRQLPERVLLGLLRAVVPPARDNQRAADFLQRSIGPYHAYVEWCVIRPDTLLPGAVSEYALHEGIVSSLFEPDSTNMANVAHFMCELATDSTTWGEWKGRMPVIVNAAGAPAATYTAPVSRRLTHVPTRSRV